METAAPYILLFVVIAGFILVLKNLRPKPSEDDTRTLLVLQNQIENLSRALDAKIGLNQQELSATAHRQFTQSQQLMNDITKQMQQSLLEMTKEQMRANESARQFLSIGEKLADLEKVLKHQKQRGNLGEASLELILSNILPPDAYSLQHRFKNGEVVDAIVKTREGFIPVDAKFSLDNYTRVTNAATDSEREAAEKDFKNDLKKRIDETAKYIRPDEDTLPFAFMFIPAEGIYYDLLINEVGSVKVNTRNLIDYAYNDKKVVIVSPTTFAAYLQSVLYGFRAFRVEEEAKNIMKRVGELSRHMKAQEDYMTKLGNSLSSTTNNFNAAFKELSKMGKDVQRITGESTAIETMELAGPTHKETE